MLRPRLTLIVVYCLCAASVALAAEEKIELFNGKDLTGWKQAGPGSFDVKDGELHTVGGMGMLWSTRELGDYTLFLEFKVSDSTDNSGVFVRFPDPGNDPWVAVKEGYEIQICEGGGNEKQTTGAIYNLHPATEKATNKPGEWNQYEITVVGQKMTVKLNGKVVNEFTGERKTPKGFIGLQNHDPKSNVSFRNISVVDLKAPATKQASLKLEPHPIDKSRVAGLVGQYFADVKSLDELKQAKQPFYVRTDKSVSFRRTKGQFYRTKLASHFGAIWTGYLRIDTPGEYRFTMKSDDGSRVFLADTLVLDSGKDDDKDKTDKDRKDKPVKLTLAAGDYPIRIEYHNLDGPGGAQFSWKPVKDKNAVIPETHLFHDASQEKVTWDSATWEKTRWSYRAWAEKYGQQWDKMDYGPFLSHTVEITEGNSANKGIAIHLGDDDQGAILFDTDLVRFAAGWTGGFLELKGVVFDGAHGTNPAPDGDMLFVTPPIPGAASGAPSESIAKDPRRKPYGTIPHELAKYRGLFLSGNRVVLHYTVGTVDVLDAPWAKTVGDQVVLTRSIRLSPSDQPLAMLIDKPNEDRGMVVMTTDDVKVEPIAGYRYVVFPPRTEATTYRLAFSRTGAVKPTDLQSIVAETDDVEALTKGGPARWTRPVVTKGEVSALTTQPYVVDTITVPETNPYHSWMRFGGLDFFSDGRAAVSTWSGDVWVVSGIDDKLEKLEWKRYATGLFQALGLRIVNDEVYVLGRDQITKLKDLNNDAEADLYECFNNDCQVSRSFHEFAFDLQTDPQGNFYFAKAGPVRPGGRGWEEITEHNGCVLKVSNDGGKFEVFATGLRAPNGMSVGPNGEVTVAENEGTWAPACKISFVKPNDFLGVVDLAHRDKKPTDYVKPICWLPHGGVDNSSGGQVWVNTDKWGPFTGRMLHTSYGTCSLFLTMHETVDGQVQGGVVKFPKLDFQSGICRPRFNPHDQQLYIAGLRGWQTTAAKDACLQRVRYTGAPIQMPTEFHVIDQGISITYSCELDPSIATDPENYAVEQWNLKWSSDYGSDEYSVIEPKEKAHDPVEVENVTLSADKKTVFLKLEEVVPVMQMKIQMKLKSVDGTPLDYSIYNTINHVPKDAGKTATTTAARD